MDKDKTRLAQWVWIVFDTGTTRRQFVLAYHLKTPKSLKRHGIDFEEGKKVYKQQFRYYQKKEYANPDPIYNFDKNLLALLSLQRMQGEKVLLTIDLNQYIYKGNFAKTLAERDIQMDKVFYRTNVIQALHLHLTGSDPIYGIFASLGINCTGYFIYYNDFGPSDSRRYGLDITMESIFGRSAPAPRQMVARNLQCDIERIRDTYIYILEKECCKQHIMDKKVDLLHQQMDKYKKHELGAISIVEI